MNILDDKNIDWNIINSYFNSDSYYFTNSQINSYNDFVLNKIPYTIKTLNPFLTSFSLNFFFCSG